MTDREINNRTIWAVVDSTGAMDANRLYQHGRLQQALDLAKELSKESDKDYLVIPVILK